MDATRGSVAGGNQQHEQLLDVFKAAALSVTKLYKTSAAAEARARSEGYQECLDEILAFLDKEKLGLGDGEGWRVRAWATERLDGRDGVQQHSDSDEEVDRQELASSPELIRASVERQATPARTELASLQPSIVSIPEEPNRIVVPSSDNFTFQSSYPNIATLDLSDAATQQATSSAPATRTSKARGHGTSRSNTRSSGGLGRGAGSKRKVDFNDFFPGVFGKDPSGNSGKRSRHL